MSKNIFEYDKIAVVHPYGKDCIGCMRHKKYAMISFIESQRSGIHDIFLTREQAMQFHAELSRVIAENESTEGT